VVLEAAGRLRVEGRSFHLAFVGTGALETAIREEVRRRDMSDCVSMHGEVERPAEVMAALDVALYAPLESDGMSRVLFEYLAAGAPVVASRVGVVPEVLRDGETALLVPAGEPGPLAVAIRRLLADRRLGAALGAAGRELVSSTLSGEAIARRLALRYTALLDGRGGGSRQ
jgi:glycosyltransferase involved in cell wall biosynthesis